MGDGQELMAADRQRREAHRPGSVRSGRRTIGGGGAAAAPAPCDDAAGGACRRGGRWPGCDGRAGRSSRRRSAPAGGGRCARGRPAAGGRADSAPCRMGRRRSLSTRRRRSSWSRSTRIAWGCRWCAGGGSSRSPRGRSARSGACRRRDGHRGRHRFHRRAGRRSRRRRRPARHRSRRLGAGFSLVTAGQSGWYPPLVTAASGDPPPGRRRQPRGRARQEAGSRPWRAPGADKGEAAAELLLAADRARLAGHADEGARAAAEAAARARGRSAGASGGVHPGAAAADGARASGGSRRRLRAGPSAGSHRAVRGGCLGARGRGLEQGRAGGGRAGTARRSTSACIRMGGAWRR